MEGNFAWMLTSSALVLIMTPGLAFFYGGMVKRKNIINTIMSSIILMGVASVLWVLIGFSLSFSGNGAFIGNLDWFGLSFDTLNDTTYAYPNTLTFAIFQMMFAIITPALISGAVAERMKFSSLVIFVTVWSIIVYYPLAHMVWSPSGFLLNIGSIDFAGGTVVHISSGVSALVLSILLGKRKNFGKSTYHPHNVPFVILGAALLWFGWFGFNAGSALAADALAAHAFMTTNTAAAAAMLSWLMIEKITSGKPTGVGAATGLVIGLVAITPGAGFVPIWAALIMGLLVSPICFLFITKVKGKFHYDDALDVFGCHGVGGIWGAIATGIFANSSINSAVEWDGLIYGDATLLIRQIIAVLISIALAVAGTFIAYGVAKLFTKDIKVSHKDEETGLDISEHGESAYPSFNGMD